MDGTVKVSYLQLIVRSLMGPTTDPMLLETLDLARIWNSESFMSWVFGALTLMCVSAVPDDSVMA